MHRVQQRTDVFVRVLLPAANEVPRDLPDRVRQRADRLPTSRFRRERPPHQIAVLARHAEPPVRSRRRSAAVFSRGRRARRLRIGEVRGERARVVQALQRGRGEARVPGVGVPGGGQTQTPERIHEVARAIRLVGIGRRRGRRTSPVGIHLLLLLLLATPPTRAQQVRYSSVVEHILRGGAGPRRRIRRPQPRAHRRRGPAPRRRPRRGRGPPRTGAPSACAARASAGTRRSWRGSRARASRGARARRPESGGGGGRQQRA